MAAAAAAATQAIAVAGAATAVTTACATHRNLDGLIVCTLPPASCRPPHVFRQCTQKTGTSGTTWRRLLPPPPPLLPLAGVHSEGGGGSAQPRRRGQLPAGEDSTHSPASPRRLAGCSRSVRCGVRSALHHAPLDADTLLELQLDAHDLITLGSTRRRVLETPEHDAVDRWEVGNVQLPHVPQQLLVAQGQRPTKPRNGMTAKRYNANNRTGCVDPSNVQPLLGSHTRRRGREQVQTSRLASQKKPRKPIPHQAGQPPRRDMPTAARPAGCCRA